MTTIRTIKLLALSALALVAIGAVSATSAQAGTFTAGSYPATITGSSAAGSHEFSTAIGVINCQPSFHGVLGAASEFLTLNPNYGTCGIEGKVVHVNDNGCDFRLRAGATIEQHVVGGSMNIICPDNAKIDFEITSEPICHVTVPGQNELGPLRYTTNTEADDVSLHFQIEALFYELDMGCPVVGAFFGGYKGTSTLKADAEGGAATWLEVD